MSIWVHIKGNLQVTTGFFLLLKTHIYILIAKHVLPKSDVSELFITLPIHKPSENHQKTEFFTACNT